MNFLEIEVRHGEIFDAVSTIETLNCKTKFRCQESEAESEL